ncbi:MAG TPA: hypothetical protein PKA98_06240 [Acidimicrobiales bacterium]|nr:hypothetical protein [Acidimicrobiales bacterium]
MLVGLGVVALLAVGCGSDDDAASPATTTTTRSAPALRSLLEEVAPEVEEARAEGDGATTTTAPTSAPPEGSGFEHTAAALRALGDSPELDAKALACFHADLTACDDLYVGSPDGSLYEVYGATCGARLDQPTNRLCVDVLVPRAEEPDGLGGDEFLDALARQCADGDLFDCDLLFAEADEGSSYEAYGATCGRRVEATDEPCADVLL